MKKSTPLIKTALFGSEVFKSIEMESWSKLRFGAAGATVLVVCISLWNAWICDDAFITFRVAENVLNGFGPLLTVGVQSSDSIVAERKASERTDPARLFIALCSAQSVWKPYSLRRLNTGSGIAWIAAMIGRQNQGV